MRVVLVTGTASRTGPAVTGRLVGDGRAGPYTVDGGAS